MSNKVTFLDWCNKYVHCQQELARLKQAAEEGAMTSIQFIQAKKTLSNLTGGIDLAKHKISELMATASLEEIKRAGQILDLHFELRRP